jgi:hypothetical protein
VAGERTGKFRLGTRRVVDCRGRKKQDFAVALADEIERPTHNRKRFTVGYQPTVSPGSAGFVLPVQGIGGGSPFGGRDIVCHMSWLYKAPPRKGDFRPPDRDMTAFGKAEELPAF